MKLHSFFLNCSRTTYVADRTSVLFIPPLTLPYKKCVLQVWQRNNSFCLWTSHTLFSSIPKSFVFFQWFVIFLKVSLCYTFWKRWKQPVVLLKLESFIFLSIRQDLFWNSSISCCTWNLYYPFSYPFLQKSTTQKFLASIPYILFTKTILIYSTMPLQSGLKIIISCPKAAKLWLAVMRLFSSSVFGI